LKAWTISWSDCASSVVYQVTVPLAPPHALDAASAVPGDDELFGLELQAARSAEAAQARVTDASLVLLDFMANSKT
jgi:hypothetical protein